MECPDGSENRVETTFHVRPVGVELDLQPGCFDNLVRPHDLLAHRYPGRH